jgi:hypothetical protein
MLYLLSQGFISPFYHPFYPLPFILSLLSSPFYPLPFMSQVRGKKSNLWLVSLKMGYLHEFNSDLDFKK